MYYKEASELVDPHMTVGEKYNLGPPRGRVMDMRGSAPSAAVPANRGFSGTGPHWAQRRAQRPINTKRSQQPQAPAQSSTPADLSALRGTYKNMPGAVRRAVPEGSPTHEGMGRFWSGVGNMMRRSAAVGAGAGGYKSYRPTTEWDRARNALGLPSREMERRIGRSPYITDGNTNMMVRRSERPGFDLIDRLNGIK